MRKLLVSVAAALALPVAAFIDYGAPPPPPARMEIIAHRGVHQDFSRVDLDDTTCTAARIFAPEHAFLENTLPSMREAFRLGATYVEIDVHETVDGGVAVFHDWTLDCRTNGHGETRLQTIDYLKTLDIGYGYSADGGETFPFRGQGVGALPALEEVLAAFPGGRFFIDHKSGDGQSLLRVLAALPEAQRRGLVYWGSRDIHARLAQAAPGVGFFNNRRGVKACIIDYAKQLFLFGLPEACRNSSLGLPYAYLAWAPGWPHRLLRKTRDAGSRFVVGSVDDLATFDALRGLPLDGIVTDHIERLAPRLETR